MLVVAVVAHTIQLLAQVWVDLVAVAMLELAAAKILEPQAHQTLEVVEVEHQLILVTVVLAAKVAQGLLLFLT
jgi:hypothetical protein